MEYTVNKKIEDLAGVNTLENCSKQRINDFALNIINDVLQLIHQTPTQQLAVTTFDLQLVLATKQNITKHIRNVYGITTN